MAPSLVFAADTLIRSRGGRFLIHTTASTLPAFESDQPMLLGWLGQFVRPTAPSAAIGQLPPADRGTGGQILDYLVRAGVLVPPDSPAVEPPTAGFSDERTRQHLRLLARAAYDLSGDLNAMGPLAEEALAAGTGLGVERRLMALLAAVDGLRGELKAVRGPYVARQLSAQGLDAGSRDLKLHLGCGGNLIDGWVNIDVYPAPVSLNVMWGLPFADGSARFVFVSHLLEHLYYPRDVQPFLADLRRVLAPGATVRIVVPDIEACIEAYERHDADFFAGRREYWSWWPKDATRLEDFLAYAGAGPEPAHLFEAHKFGYDYETLASALAKAGLVDIRRCSYMQSAYPELRVDDHSEVARARYGDRYYSLFVEARAP